MPTVKGAGKTVPSFKYAALGAVLAGAGLKLVDVGGRGEAFPGILTLAEFAEYFVSEPDVAECDRLRAELPAAAPWKGVTVFAEAMSASASPVTLNVTRRPGMSSLLEPDLAVASDFYLGNAYEVVERVDVPALTLDAAASRYGFEDAAFLKMDTQGTELDILQSGPRLVADSLVAIHTEAHFRPFYKEQPLFAELDQHLRREGFSLLSLNRTSLRRSGYDETVFSRRSTTWAHCLYVREPAQLLGRRADPGRDLARLLGLMVALKHFDLAFDIVAMLAQARLGSGHDLAAVSADVKRAAADGTAYALRKASEFRFADGLLDGARRDSRRVD